MPCSTDDLTGRKVTDSSMQRQEVVTLQKMWDSDKAPTVLYMVLEMNPPHLWKSLQQMFLMPAADREGISHVIE